MGFFQREARSRSKADYLVAAKCGICGRKKGCKTPCIPLGGDGQSKILIVKESPTKENDLKGSWFGSDVRFVDDALGDIDLDLCNDCWLTGAVVCYGASDLDCAAGACQFKVLDVIRRVQPEIIITLGKVATTSILSNLVTGDDIGDASRFYGYRIPVAKWNAWLCPTYDINEAMSNTYGNGAVSGTGVVTHLWFKRHIAEVQSLLGTRPFNADTIKPQQKVEFLYSVEDVSSVLEYVGNSDKGYAAFDYETNCVKPEVDGARILCASVCYGGYNKDWKTVAFPMSSDIVPVWCKFLRSRIPKIAHNLKFEDRWCNVALKTAVNNWYADTYLNTHILDCRRGVAGLKFQAMVNYGEIGYGDKAKSYMNTKTKINRLHTLPIEELLLYNGLDSLFEWRLAVQQFRELNIKPYW
jgi:uracil-DNA glycosylase family 4